MPDFINCPKCGTRNFADDKACGVCGAEFVHGTIQNDAKPAPIPWTGILMVGLIALVILIVVKANLAPSPSNKNSVTISKGSIDDSPVDNSPVNYYIENVENKPTYCLINVRVKNKISKQRLESLSEEIKNGQDCNSDRVRIFYILPETKKDNGAWVRVDYNPAFSMEFLAPSLEEENYARAHKGKLKIIGAWIDNNSGEPGIAQRIRYNSDGKLIMEYYEISEPDHESSLASELRKVVKSGKTIFKVVDSNTDDHYVLQPNGNLACYDNQGLIMILKKL
jgi:hypothetical protein